MLFIFQRLYSILQKKALVFVDHRIKKDYCGRNAVFKLRLNNDNYWEIEDSLLVSTS